MRLPWRRRSLDLPAKAAAACFGAAHNYMQKPTLGDISQLDAQDYYTAVCEVVCVLLHLADRTIFETIPHLRQARMDAFVSATVDVLAQEIRPGLTDPAEAEAVATGMLIPMYDGRMDEYAAVGEDWLRLVLSKFGTHFSKAVNGGELSMVIYMDAQAEAGRMYGALLEFVPEMFKP